MFGRDAYTLLMQSLNLKIRYIRDDKSLLALHVLKDICALSIHNIKLFREREIDQILTYPVPEYHLGDKVLVRNPTRDVWKPKYDIAYHVVCEVG